MKKIIYNEYHNKQVIELGAKIIPTNLNDCMNKAAYFMANNHETFCNSNFCDNIGIIYNNNNIRNNNNNVEYTNIVTKLLCDIKSRATHELIDVHFFPIKYPNNNENKEVAYVDYNLRKALISMLVNFENWKWLVNATHCEFELEYQDVEKTLWYIANRLTDKKYIRKERVNAVLQSYSTDLKEWASDNFRNFENIVDVMCDMNTYIADRINFDKMDNNKLVRISVYGEKDYGWREIVHKNGEMCLYFTPIVKKYLKRINKSMTGQKFHKYVNELLGKWFDLNDKSAWDCFRKNMSRTIDDLDENICVEACKMMVQQYIDNMKRFYDGEMVDETKDIVSEKIQRTTVISKEELSKNIQKTLSETKTQTITKPVQNTIQNNNSTSETIVINPVHRETVEEAQKALEEKRKTEWKDITIPDVTDPDYWTKIKQI